MEEFDLYGDLELLHEVEKQNAIEDLKWKDKYKVALITIEKLQVENKDLKKKIKQLETNFASLFDTARGEIKRKDNLICELRKQKDDICFRRSKPQFDGRQINEDSDVRRAASSESVHINPFSRQPRKENPTNTEASKQFSNEKLPQRCENNKRKHDKANSRERDPRNVCHERDESPERERHRNRSKNRSRHRNRSRDRIDERSRHPFIDLERHNSKDRDHFKKDLKCNKSEKKDDRKRKRQSRDSSPKRGSDSSCEKNDKTHCRSPRTNNTNGDESTVSSNRYESKKNEEKPKDVCKSDSDQITDSKTELNQLKNVPSPNDEKRLNSKVEILQIEILKDVKELKKNKLKADNIPKPDPIDAAEVTTEKSNTFFDALFDDSVMNESEKPDDDLYDDLIVCNQQLPVLVPEDTKKENHLEKDVNYNSNFHTPQRQTFLDLFGSSPASSLCPLVTRQDSVKSTCGSSNDSDFVLITKSVRSAKVKIPHIITTPKVPLDDICSQTDETIQREFSGMKPPKKLITVDLNNDNQKFVKIDENFNFKQQTPQKQVCSKLMDDLFGQSPSSSICGQKNSVTCMDETSSDFKPVNNECEEKYESNLSKTPIVIDNNFVKCNENIEACSTENNARRKVVNNAKTFKFVELDSSFYSSDDEINDNLSEKFNTPKVKVESPTFENFTPLKKEESFETQLNNLKSEGNKSVNSNVSTKSDEILSDLNSAKDITCESIFKNQTKNVYVEKTSRAEKPGESKKSKKNKKRGELCKNDDAKKSSITSKDSMLTPTSEENRQQSRSPKSEKEKRRHHHKHHHHRRKHKDHFQETTHTKSDSSSHSDKIKAENHNKSDLTSSKNEVSKARSSPMLVYYDDDSMKDSTQNEKVTDQDQVFFLHCDDISSDEEIIGEKSFSKENNDKSDNHSRQSISAITNDIDSNKKSTDSFSSSDKQIDSIISRKHENSECMDIKVGLIFPVEPKIQNKDLAHVAKELSNHRIQENIFNAICSSVDPVEKKTDICDIKTNTVTSTNVITSNCPEDVDDQQCSKDYHFQSPKSTSENENNLNEIQKNQNAQVETINLDGIDAIQLSANHKNEQVTHESIQKTDEKGFHDLKDKNVQNKEDKSELHSALLHSTNHHVELNKSLNNSHTEQSNYEDNEKVNNYNAAEIGNVTNLSNEVTESNFAHTFKNEKPSCDGKFKMCLEEQSDCQLLTKDQVQSAEVVTPPKDEHCEASSRSITHLKISKSFENLQKITVETPEDYKEKVVSNKIIEQISVTTTNDLVSRSNSAERLSSQVPPQKLHDSADEFESSHSSLELVSTGRRKKIKTPRKRTDICVCTDGSNATTIMISDRYAKCNDTEASSCVHPEISYKLISPNKDTENFERNKTKIEENREKMSSSYELNGTLEDVKEISTDELQQEKQKPKSSPNDSNNQSSESNIEELPVISLKSDDISKALLSSDQQKENLGVDEYSPPMTLPPSTLRENEVENTEDVCEKLEDTENVNKNDSILIEAEKMPPLGAVISQGNNYPISELTDTEKKEDDLNEKIIEASSITIKRNRNKRKNIHNSVENVEAVLNNVKNSTLFCGEILVEEPLALDLGTEKNKIIKEFGNGGPNCDFLEKSNNKASDNSCSSSTTLISTLSISENIENQPNEQQMMKHFMDSEYSLVGTCNYLSANCSDQALKTSLKEKSVKKRKLKTNTSLDNSHCELKKKSTESPLTCGATNVNVKRKYKKKCTQILDSSNSDEDVGLISGIISEETKVLSNGVTKNPKYLPRTLDGPCNYSSVTNFDEVVNKKLTETNVNKRKLRNKTKFEKPECELKVKAKRTDDIMESMVKKQDNRKSKVIVDSLNRNADIQVTSITCQESQIVPYDECETKKQKKAMNDLKSTEPTKKRKYKKAKLNSSSDSTDKSNELKETPSSPSMLRSSINCEKTLHKIYIPHPTAEKLDERTHTAKQTTNLRFETSSSYFSGEKELPVYNNSLHGEEKDEDLCNIKHKKTKGYRKRKLSRSSDTKSDQVTVQSKRSKNNIENSSQSSIEISCPVSEENFNQEPIKQPQQSPRSRESSVSIALTPTHHKIFLNDVFPNIPPPVYNANEDDHQYHEIDDRLRSMFQSPSYNPPSNVELPTNTKNDDINGTSEENVTIEETLNHRENVLVNETLNQSERTKCDTSAGSRKVSLGSNEYVIESIGSHSANVFITRKKSKKRTKVVATAV